MWTIRVPGLIRLACWGLRFGAPVTGDTTIALHVVARVAAFAHGRLTGLDAAVILGRMDERYHAGSRRLQDRFDTRRLADRIDERTGRDHIRPEDRAFIERMDMFFLATSDVGGQPQCSYKGGDPGFVHVLDEHTLAFPNYDGNGMFLSWGNALVNPKVGLLFIDFVAERPTRLRIEGTASVRHDDDLLADCPEAQFVVRVQATRVFPNCPRYIHRMALVERSSYVPRAGIATPIPDWKRGELATGVLPKGDPAATLDESAELTRDPDDDHPGG